MQAWDCNLKKWVDYNPPEPTPEELAEWEAEEERRRQEEANAAPPEPTTDERLAELEEALEMLLSGVTSDET